MDVLDIQRRLAELGFNPGPLDGAYGPQTRAAIMAALDTLKSGKASPEPPVARTEGKSPVWNQPKASRAINEVIIHCTATPDGRDVSVETIRGWHKDRGWKDIGYHWIVMLDGTVKPGRPEAQIGAHVAGHNTGTIGVVYVGGVAKDGKTPKDTRTPAQKAALIETVKALIAKYPTIRKVSGHNDHTNAKACPSFKVGNDPLGKLV